jgi:hypothetical protein
LRQSLTVGMHRHKVFSLILVRPPQADRTPRLLPPYFLCRTNIWTIGKSIRSNILRRILSNEGLQDLS